MRPTLVYDGDCGACSVLAGVVRRRLRPDATVVAWQSADLAALGLTPEECDAALQWVDASGRTYAAQRAVARLLLASRPAFRPLGLVLRLPVVDPLAGMVYRLVARNRHRLLGGTASCAVPPVTAIGGDSSASVPLYDKRSVALRDEVIAKADRLISARRLKAK